MSEGTWEVISRYQESYFWLHFKGVTIVKTKNDEVLEMISVERANLSGKEMGAIDNIVNTVMFKNPYDGCYERPEYFLVNYYKKEAHIIVWSYVTFRQKKELYTPDDPENSLPLIKNGLMKIQ